MRRYSPLPLLFPSSPRLRRVVAGLALFGALSALPAGAAGLGFFAARRVHNEADQALAAGQNDKAFALYQELADGTSPGSSKHADALLGMAIAQLGKPTGSRDLGVARTSLEAYLKEPSADNKPLVRILAASLSSLPPMPADATPPVATTRRPPPPPSRGSAAEAKELEQLRSQVASLEEKLKQADEQLAQKDKLIEELRQIVVQGDG